jgi:uroporphyrinogen decarboxylase
MREMSSRQRVVRTLEHCEPDRVPWDCNFTMSAYLKLMDYIGLKHEGELKPNWGTIIRPCKALMEELQVDLHYIHLSASENAPPFEYGVESYTDEWGVTYRKVHNPSGFYYEFSDHPLANATIRDLEDYPWPDPYEPSRIEGLEERCRDLYENTDFTLVGKFSTPIFEQAFYLRGYEQWLIDLATNPDFACALMDKLTDISIALAQSGLKVCGKYIQIYRVAGDDQGHQHGTILSPKMFRELVKPRFKRLYQSIKSTLQECNLPCKLKAHTDGDVYPIISDYIDMGLDVLNPVQPYVAEMDHARLKKEFGSLLSFHGGIDIQRVLPFGTSDEVKMEAKKTMEILGRGGGYILAPTHYVQADVPPENIIALRDAVLEHGRYPL